MNQTTNNIVVETMGLGRKFGKTQALIDINLKLERGVVYGLVGANGAGKTTLIKHLLGLLRCQQGSVRVFGEDPVLKPQSVLSHIGYLSEERDIPDWMSIGEFCDYVHAFHPAWDENYARELLESFNLTRDKRVGDLSRGMRAQLALIGAVAHKPDLLVLDEPSSGLDAIVRKDILNAVVRTIAEEGRTVLFSSHLLEEVERLSEHVIMIQEGSIVVDEPMEFLGQTHHVSEFRFSDVQSALPRLDAVLKTSGEGRSWNVIHSNSPEQLHESLRDLQGELISTRNASLEEIFIARVGRIQQQEGISL
ncbi:MAG: ABC transporter ATP-binding protein [Gammaproteobacteria bacterium]